MNKTQIFQRRNYFIEALKELKKTCICQGTVCDYCIWWKIPFENELKGINQTAKAFLEDNLNFWENYCREDIINYPIALERAKKRISEIKEELESLHSQGKKDSSDSPNTNYLETQSIAGEGNQSGRMPVGVDNHPDKTGGVFAQETPVYNPDREEIKK